VLTKKVFSDVIIERESMMGRVMMIDEEVEVEGLEGRDLLYIARMSLHLP
jgi:hypothetical protein